MKNFKPIFIVLISVLVACKPSQYTYQAEKTKGTDYSKYKTYAFLPTKDTSYTKLADKAKVEKALAKLVMAQLNERGMKLDTLNPDCLFTYTLVVTRSQQVGPKAADPSNTYAYSNAYYGDPNIYYYRVDYGPATYGGGIAVTSFRDGSLVIDMIDRKDNKIIWRSSAQARKNENELEGVWATAKEIVPAMFKRFPVKQ